jgi:hypothetical protein
MRIHPRSVRSLRLVVEVLGDPGCGQTVKLAQKFQNFYRQLIDIQLCSTAVEAEYEDSASQ